MSPYQSSFDTLTNVAADLAGEITDVQVFDEDIDPNHVLSREMPWSVKVNWEISGLCAPGIGGDWVIRVILESMGTGYEGTLKEEVVPVSEAVPALTRCYDKIIDLPSPNTDAPDLGAGTYKLVIVILHTNTGGGETLRTRMAGFCEGPLLEFIDHDVP